MLLLNLDIGPFIDLKQHLRSDVEAAMAKATRDLSHQAHAHIVEQVQSKLHSTRQKYLDALHYAQVDKETWVISLDKNAMFIEEGIKPNTDMLDGLLKSPKAKTGKDGSRYIVVPFEHSKGPTSQTPAQTTLTQTIKSEMKSRGIKPGIESGADGKPKSGLLHSFDVMHLPPKTQNGPGQGHGPVGGVRQGPTGIPFLQGVRVYQKPIKDKSGHESMKKSIMTFRIASSKHRGQGRWVHPGLEAKKFLDEAAKWALEEWETKMRDQVLKSISP